MTPNTIDSKDSVNSEVWDNLYQQRKSLLSYPDSSFVTLLHRHLTTAKHGHILDYGFGGGANMRVMLKRGHKVDGIEISDTVIEINNQILEEQNLVATLHNVQSHEALPFTDEKFDAVVAWHVLGYNSLSSLQSRICEFIRVLKKGGCFIGTIPAYGDVSHDSGEAKNAFEFVSKVPTQNGAQIVCFESEQAVCEAFNLDMSVALLQSPLMDGSFSRHWVFLYEK